MRKYFAIFLALVFFSIPFVFAQENITITTYYPSPAGVFNQLLVNGQGAVGDVNGDGQINQGDFAHDNAGNLIEGSFTVAATIGIGTNNPRGELQINSTDACGTADLILVGEDTTPPVPDTPVGMWDVSVLGACNADSAGNLTFTDTTYDALGNPTGTTTPVTFESGAPNNSFVINNDGSITFGANMPLRIPWLAADPDAAHSENGMIYYNTTNNRFRAFQDGHWIDMVSGVQMAAGFFKGDGATFRTIDLDFVPRLVILIPHGESSTAHHADNPIIKMAVYPTKGDFWGDGSYPPGTGGKYVWTTRYIKDTEGYDNPFCQGCTSYSWYSDRGINLNYDENGRYKNFTIQGINEVGRQYSWMAFGWEGNDQIATGSGWEQ